MHVVPDRIPYENGKLWTGSNPECVHAARIEPEQARDRRFQRTAHYTGRYVADADDGTSISLGYIAESYIDFGPVLMALPLVVWGYFVGRIPRPGALDQIPDVRLCRCDRHDLLGRIGAGAIECQDGGRHGAGCGGILFRAEVHPARCLR